MHRKSWITIYIHDIHIFVKSKTIQLYTLIQMCLNKLLSLMKYPQILKTDINQPLLISCHLSLPFQHILAFGFSENVYVNLITWLS